MFDRETTEIYNVSYHVVGLRGLKGGGGGGGGTGGGGGSGSGNGEEANIGTIIGIIVLSVLLLICLYGYNLATQRKIAEFQTRIDQAREKFLSNERIIDPSIKTYKPMNGSYAVKYTEVGSNSLSGTTTLYFTDLNDGSGYSISGSSMDADGKATIEEGFVRYDGSDAYWTDQVYEGEHIGLRVLNTGFFDFKSLRFTGRYLSSNGLGGSFLKFKLVGAGGDPISDQSSQFTAIVFKETADTKTGIKLADENRKIIVTQVSELFAQTDLKIGDEILKVNGTSVVGKDSSFVIELIRSLRESITINAKRPISEFNAIVFKETADTKTGIKLADDENRKIIVTQVSELFAQTDLKIGDEILKVNGTSVVGKDSSFAIELIGSLRQLITITAKRPSNPGASPDSETVVANVYKSSTDTKVGITLNLDEQGKIVVDGLTGLFAATELQVGDEIVMVNGKPVRGNDSFYATGIIKDSTGSVTVIACRKFVDEIALPVAYKVYEESFLES